MLDGFNEVTAEDKTLLIDEIKEIINEYRNIQLIIYNNSLYLRQNFLASSNPKSK